MPLEESAFPPPFYAIEIKRRRIGWHISQSELAQMTGLNQRTISRIEQGVGNPTVETLERIAKALRAELTVNLRNPIHHRR